MNTLRQIRHLYKNESPATRLHVLCRTALCPFVEMLRYFPASGNILDIGCGHGILSNLLFYDSFNRGRKLTGVDHAAGKIDIAARHSNSYVKFLHTSPENLADNEFDAISIVDVLYTIDMDKWKALLDSCFRILKPNGLLIVKEVVNRPRWKYWLLLLEERLAVEVFKITKGDRPHVESIEIYSGAFEKSGFIVTERKPLNNRSWVGHFLFVAHKP